MKSTNFEPLIHLHVSPPVTVSLSDYVAVGHVLIVQLL